MMKTKLKFFLVLLGLMVGGVNGAWANELYFINKVVNFTNGTFSPASATDVNDPTLTDCFSFRQDAMWKWTSSSDPNNMDDPNCGQCVHATNSAHTQDKDFTWVIDVVGSGITIPEDIVDSSSGNHYVLKKGFSYASLIRFKLADPATTKGSIKVTIYNYNFQGSSYSTYYTININKSIPSKHWDFYTTRLDIGLSSESGSTFKNIIDAGAMTISNVSGYNNPAEKTALYWYNNAISNDVFTISYGETSYTVPEVSGLKFNGSSGTIGISNNDQTYISSPTRYIALKEGAKVTIPSTEWSGWSGTGRIHVRVKMGRYGAGSDGAAGIRLNIINGNDALDRTIAANSYKIGGSSWWGDKSANNPYQRGEYHFIIPTTGESSDFSIEVVDGQWLELYSIEVYKSDEFISENSILSTNYHLLNTKNSGNNAQGVFYLHYRGKGEHVEVDDISYTGTLNNSNLTRSTSDNINHTFVASNTNNADNAAFGTFRMRMKCCTMTYDDKYYYTDYAYRKMAVGFRETMNYPYTWDFSDVHTYKFVNGYSLGDGRMGTEGNYSADKKLWLEGNESLGEGNSYSIQLSPTATSGTDYNFCSGSQLWYGTTMIPEARGLAFTPLNFDASYNTSIIMQSGSMKFNQNLNGWWGWRVTVPSVPVGAAVYVRAKDSGGSANYRMVSYNIGATVIDKNLSTTVFTEGSPANKVAVSGSNNEYIYAVYNNENSAKDITLHFNNVEVSKIAVSTDAKQFNAKGWTTESRTRDIDPSLTAYMTGHNIKTYLVTKVTYSDKTVELTEIGSNTTTNYLMHKSTANDDEYACILRNDADAQLNIVNSSFHLFAPDMHDEQGETTGTDYKKKNYYTTITSKMKSRVNGGTIAYKTGDYWNYGLGYQYYDIDPNTGKMVSGSPLHTGAVAFYRIEYEGASSAANKGYLPVLMSAGGGAARFSIVFADGDENQSVGIVANETESTGNGNYYNLNGQRLNGEPSRHGLYIVNGKKMYVK